MVNRNNPSALVQEFMATGRSAKCPIIDMHGHWGPLGGSYLPAGAEDVMIAALRRQGVKRIVCVSHEALFEDPLAGNHTMQDAIDRYPDLLLGYWGVNPNYPEQSKAAAQHLKAARGFVGFKFLPDYHCYPLTGPNYATALAHAEASGLAVLIHTWSGSKYNAPSHVETLAKQYPNARLLMGHSGYGDWETSTRIAAEYPNVYLELTAVYVPHDFTMLPAGSGTPTPLASCLQVNGIIEYMVERAGAQKILFGTDLPWYSPLYAAGAVLFARIDDDVRHAILHRNAEALLDTLCGSQDDRIHK